MILHFSLQLFHFENITSLDAGLDGKIYLDNQIREFGTSQSSWDGAYNNDW